MWRSLAAFRGRPRAQRRFQPQPLCRLLYLGRLSEDTAHHRAPHRLLFRFRGRRLDVRLPVSRQGDGAFVQPCRAAVLRPLPEARPTPVRRTLDQTGPQRVALCAAQNRQQVFVVLDGEGFESPLVDGTGALGVGKGAIALRVRDR